MKEVGKTIKAGFHYGLMITTALAVYAAAVLVVSTGAKTIQSIAKSIKPDESTK